MLVDGSRAGFSPLGATPILQLQEVAGHGDSGWSPVHAAALRRQQVVC